MVLLFVTEAKLLASATACEKSTGIVPTFWVVTILDGGSRKVGPYVPVCATIWPKPNPPDPPYPPDADAEPPLEDSELLEALPEKL
jgi:hypothetical protein